MHFYYAPDEVNYLQTAGENLPFEMSRLQKFLPRGTCHQDHWRPNRVAPPTRRRNGKVSKSSMVRETLRDMLRSE
jgi:hypothetical protein